MKQGMTAIQAATRARLAILAALLLAALAFPGRAGAVALKPVGTFNAPVYVTSPPSDSRLFIVEQAGRIKVFKNGATLGTDFLDISTLVASGGERGLLSMAFDPGYASNGLFYVFYTGNTTAGGLDGDIHIDEFKVSANADVANALSRREVLTIPHSSAGNHNGGQLQFGRDGELYISVGDAANGANSQANTNLLGKLLRIDPHGAAPGDHSSPPTNPYVGVAGSDEIWSLGLRNPFRFSFDRLTGAIAIGDVGAGSWEEVDYATEASGLARNANFGWPNREGCGGGPCDSATYTDPIFVYPNAGVPMCGSAVIGGYVYRGTDIPELVGRYLYADLCVHQLRSFIPGLPLAADDRSEGIDVGAPVHSFGEDSRCELYIAAPPTVYKIVSSTGAPQGGGCATSAAASQPGAAPSSPAASRKSCKSKKTKRKRRRCHRKRKRKRGH